MYIYYCLLLLFHCFQCVSIQNLQEVVCDYPCKVCKPYLESSFFAQMSFFQSLISSQFHFLRNLSNGIFFVCEENPLPFHQVHSAPWASGATSCVPARRSPRPREHAMDRRLSHENQNRFRIIAISLKLSCGVLQKKEEPLALLLKFPFQVLRIESSRSEFSRSISHLSLRFELA